MLLSITQTLSTQTHLCVHGRQEGPAGSLRAPSKQVYPASQFPSKWPISERKCFFLVGREHWRHKAQGEAHRKQRLSPIYVSSSSKWCFSQIMGHFATSYDATVFFFFYAFPADLQFSLYGLFLSPIIEARSREQNAGREEESQAFSVSFLFIFPYFFLYRPIFFVCTLLIMG